MLKKKIISAFVLLLALLGLVVFAGCRYLRVSADSFAEYRRLSGFDALLGDMALALRGAGGGLERYAASGGAEALAAAREHIDTLDSMLLYAGQYAGREGIRSGLTGLLDMSGALRNGLGRADASLHSLRRRHEDLLRLTEADLPGGFEGLRRSMGSINNVTGLLFLGESLAALADLRAVAGRFSVSLAEADMELLLKRREELDASLQKMGEILLSRSSRGIYNRVLLDQRLLRSLTEDMYVALHSLRVELRQCGEIGKAMTAGAEKLRAGLRARLSEHNRASLEAGNLAQKELLGFSLGGLALGLLFLGIIFGLIRVFGEARAFVPALFAGKVKFRRAREKDPLAGLAAASASSA
jgi:hypothetical protein